MSMLPPQFAAVSSVKNAELQKIVAKKLKTKKISQFPGEKVDVFMRENLEQLARGEFLVASKTNGQNFLLVGLAQSKKRMNVYFVNAKYKFHLLLSLKTSDMCPTLPKSFIVNGELAQPTDESGLVFQVFDVRLVKNVYIGNRKFVSRLKLFVTISSFLQTCVREAVHAEHGQKLSFELKQFFSPKDSLAHVLGLARFESDGLIFTSVVDIVPSFKWKPRGEISVDFQVGSDDRVLVLADDTGELAGRFAQTYPQFECGDIVECAIQLDKFGNLRDEHRTEARDWEWVPLRARKDKTTPNSVHVWKRNVALILDHIGINELVETATSQMVRADTNTNTNFSQTAEKKVEKEASSMRRPSPVNYGMHMGDASPSTLAVLAAETERKRAVDDITYRQRVESQFRQPHPRQPHPRQPQSVQALDQRDQRSPQPSSTYVQAPTCTQASTYTQASRNYAQASSTNTYTNTYTDMRASAHASRADFPSKGTMYFAPTGVATRRLESNSKAMKGFHNTCVKNSLYARFLPGARSLLELGIGRGSDNDRQRSYGPDLVYFMGVDNDASALDECKRRWDNAVKRQKGEYVEEHDSRKRRRRHTPDPCKCDEINTVELDLNNVDACMDCFAGQPRFDLVMCMFSLHYFYQNVHHTLIETVAEGGHFIATFFNRKFVDALVPRNGQVVEWSIQGKVQTRVRRISETRIGVFIDTIGREHEEDLVDAEELINRLPADFEVIEFLRPFTTYSSERSAWYGPEHPMWSLTALYCTLIVRRRVVRRGRSTDRSSQARSSSSTRSPSRTRSRSRSRSGRSRSNGQREAYSPGDPGYYNNNRTGQSRLEYSPGYPGYDNNNNNDDYYQPQLPHGPHPSPPPPRSCDEDTGSYMHSCSPQRSRQDRRSCSRSRGRLSRSRGQRCRSRGRLSRSRGQRSRSRGRGSRGQNYGYQQPASSPIFAASSPAHLAASSRTYIASSPAFTASSPVFTASSPAFTASSPVFTASSPVFTASSPVFTASSPVFTASSPVFNTVLNPDAPYDT
jgi:hypothetical protein